MSRPSDAFEQDELREEYDWIYEFQSRMAERITGDKDVHNLVDYVGKLEAENDKQREQIETLVMYVEADGTRYWVDDDGNQHFDHSAVKDDAAKLRELVRRLYNMADFCRNCPDTERCDVDVEWLGCTVADPIDKLMEELGVEV